MLFTTDGLDLNHRNLNDWGEELHVIDVCRPCLTGARTSTALCILHSLEPAVHCVCSCKVCRLERTMQRLHKYAVSSPQLHHAHAMQSWRNARVLSTKCHMEPIFELVTRAALGPAGAGGSAAASNRNGNAGGSEVCAAQRRTNQRVASMVNATKDTWYQLVKGAEQTEACVAKVTAGYWGRRKLEKGSAAQRRG